jgi:spermidine synthase
VIASGSRPQAPPLARAGLVRRVTRAPRLVWAALLGGLALSGVAGIVNQVVWQRALKIFLGGSETLSAMVVVEVFLLGLGLGAALAARVAPRLRDPLRALALVELGLAAGNAAVALVLGLDISESVYAAQRLAVSAGLPLRAVYAAGSAALLLGPTVAMGATMPLASEACQRQLGASNSRLVPVLFFVNTIGAALGAGSASALLLPALGQRRALLVAVGFNAVAGVVIGALARRPAAPAAATEGAPRGAGLTREEVLGGVLGFLALGYEMVLFRILALAHQPVPTTFATGLAGFLLAWSVGVALANRVRGGSVVAVVTAALVAAAPLLFTFDAVHPLPVLAAAALYALPCVGFGCLYGQLVARAAEGDWGRDVGRYAAVNTLGSCAGVLFFTLVGYEVPQHLDALAIAAGLVAVAAVFPGPLGPAGGRSGLALLAAAVGVGLMVRGWRLPYTEGDGSRVYWGRDGVVEVLDDGNVWIDGLWHTKLSDGTDHVGRPYSWVMALAAVLAHGDDPPPRRALVIGAGVGISSVTLAGVEGLQVDGYEINHTLRRVLRDYPEQTLHASDAPNVRWIWQDARTGLALDETRYDVILSAPLYLRQAGSSLLLSREYLRLVKSRLRPGGVLAVYSNEGSPAQVRLVQRTLSELFAHRVTWYDGIVTVASDSEITVPAEALAAFLARPDRLAAEARRLDAELRAEGGDGLYGLYEGERYTGVVGDQVITDDQPLVEYPELAERWVGVR